MFGGGARRVCPCLVFDIVGGRSVARFALWAFCCCRLCPAGVVLAVFVPVLVVWFPIVDAHLPPPCILLLYCFLCIVLVLPLCVVVVVSLLVVVIWWSVWTAFQGVSV